MNTFETITAARKYAEGNDKITHIAQIEPGMPGINPYICMTCDIATIKRTLAKKPMVEIKRVIGTAADLAAERRADREAKIRANVPGLTKLKTTIDAWNYYQDSFGQMMEDEMNDGINPPQRPKTEVATIAAQYPVASAYIKADNWEMASHYAKSAAGRKAKKRIGDGEDYKKVITDMEKEWSDHTKTHMWD